MTRIAGSRPRRRCRPDPAVRVDGQQLDDAPLEPRFLAQLADGRVLGMLAEVDAATRKRPRTRRLGDGGEAAEQQAIVGDADVVRRAREPVSLTGEFRVPLLAERGHALDDVK